MQSDGRTSMQGQTAYGMSVAIHYIITSALYMLCRFQAVLTVRGMESLFKILEINDFKQLPHITLAFRPGNDAAVKQVRHAVMQCYDHL